MPSTPSGDLYIADEVSSMPIADLAGAVIGVEASAFLQQLVDQPPTQEPLLAALGGEPISFRHHIEEELNRWKAANIKPIFILDGQSVVGKSEMAMRRSKAALVKMQKAWNLYGDSIPDEAVKGFGAAGGVRATDFYGVLLSVLEERGLDWKIAPFSAGAQLAHLDNLETQYIDAIMGSQELLIYDVNDAVMFVPTQKDWTNKSFTGVFKSELIKKLNVSPEMFADALLMTGTSFLPAFPPLEDPEIIRTQPFVIQDAINLLRTSEKSVTSTCTSFSDILQQRDPNWLDRYRKAKMSVKHAITLNEDGSSNVKDFGHLTGDNHDYLGLQLPPELYHYLSKAVIGPRLMSTFPLLEFLVFPTLDGVMSNEYRKLTTQSLIPIKEITAGLITSRIHRGGFLYRAIHQRFWFDDKLKIPLDHRGVQVQANKQVDTWGVRDTVIKAQEITAGCKPGKLSFAVLSLQTDFSSQSKAGEVSGLSVATEVLPNALWRLLHLRGYVDDNHELTVWGKALATTLKALAPTIRKHNDDQHVEEAAFIAYELLQFDCLNGRNRHTDLIGGPIRGTDEDKVNCMLIGRTACLLKLRHKNIGYTGPLSKNYLHYYSIIKSVREAVRDMLEAVVASMLLSGQAMRDKSNFVELGRSIPFGTDINVALGIAVKTYLDDHFKVEWKEDERAAAKTKYALIYLPHANNFPEDLDVAFAFFDALHEGVKTLTDKEIGVKDRKAWDNAATYLAQRR